MTITRQKLARWDMPMGDAVTERRHGGGYRCGFGGDSSSSSSETTTVVTTNTDKRLVVDGMSTGLSFDHSSSNNITLTDAGAVKAAGDVSAAALKMAGGAVTTVSNTLNDVVSNALATVGITTSGALGTANTALNTVNDVNSNSLAAMGVTASQAINSAAATSKTLMTEATRIMNRQAETNASSFSTLLDTMLELNRGSNAAAAANIGLTKDLAASANSAYADATATASGTKNIVLAGLAVVGLAVVMMMGKH